VQQLLHRPRVCYGRSAEPARTHTQVGASVALPRTVTDITEHWAVHSPPATTPIPSHQVDGLRGLLELLEYWGTEVTGV
jgi:hypothetical protein